LGHRPKQKRPHRAGVFVSGHPEPDPKNRQDSTLRRNVAPSGEMARGRYLDDIIENLPAERQSRITTLAQTKVEEMIPHASTLSHFRKAVGKTQADIAKIPGRK